MRRARDFPHTAGLNPANGGAEPPFPCGKRFSRTSLLLICSHLQELLPSDCHSVDHSRPNETNLPTFLVNSNLRLRRTFLAPEYQSLIGSSDLRVTILYPGLSRNADLATSTTSFFSSGQNLLLEGGRSRCRKRRLTRPN